MKSHEPFKLAPNAHYKLSIMLLLSLLVLLACTAFMAATRSASAFTGSRTNDLASTQADKEAKPRTYPQALSEWRAWTKDHAYVLTSIQPEEPVNGTIPEERVNDLNMLVPLLADKRLVYLGESSHGTAEFSLAKTRLIQYLHQTLGFSVVAFESGLGDTALAQGTITTETAEDTLKRSLFPVWWTEETLPLFKYMKETHNSAAPLRLTGFDIQVQTSLFQNTAWVSNKELLDKVERAEKDMNKWRQSTDLAGYRKAKQQLINVYTNMMKEAASQAGALKLAYPNEPHIVKLMERSLQDRVRVVQEFNELSITANLLSSKGDHSGMLKVMGWRDRAMASNLVWLATEVYPEETIIVWGHNGHISKAQSSITNMPKSMGELMPTEWKRRSYVLGLFMAGGESATNKREPLPVDAPMPGTLEHIVSATNHPYTFLDIRYRENERDNSWMFERTIANYEVMIPMLLEPRQHMDGILLIDKVRMPKYLP